MIITAYNLPDEAYRRAGVSDPSLGIVLDVPASVSLRLTKSVETLHSDGKLKTEGALGFSLHHSPANDAVLFKFIYLQSIDRTNEWVDVTVTFDGGHNTQFERLYFKGYRQGRDLPIDVEFRRGASGWLEKASEYTIDQIDFGNYEITEETIRENWGRARFDTETKGATNNSNPFLFQLFDYGGWMDEREKEQGSEIRQKALSVEDFRPLVSIVHLLKQGFCDIGYTLEGLIFETDFVRRWWCYLLRENYCELLGENRGWNIILGNGQIDYSSGGSFTPITNNVQWIGNAINVVEDGFGNKLAGSKNTSGVDLHFTFDFSARIINNTDETITISIFVNQNINGGIESVSMPNENIFTLPQGESVFVNVSMSGVVKSGASAFVWVDLLNQVNGQTITFKTAYFKATLTKQALHTKDVIEIRKLIHPYALIDCFKAFLHLTNSNYQTDELAKTVTVYPERQSDVYGYSVTGFLMENDEPADLTEIQVENSVTHTPRKNTALRFTELGFAQNSDEWIKQQVQDEQPYDRKILNSYDLPDGVEEISNPLFGATLEGCETDDFAVMATGADDKMRFPTVPRLWDNTNGERSFRISPRIFYSYGKVRQITPVVLPAINADIMASFYFNRERTTLLGSPDMEFGYATMVATLPLENSPPQRGISFAASDSLFSIFYLGSLRKVLIGNDLSVLFWLKRQDYFAFNFRRLVKFRHLGRDILAQALTVRDFDTTKEIPTPIELFLESPQTTCCDLPCGCVFITCDYYQDLSENMLQSTLDGLTITKFTVDGISQIVAPVGFGIIKVVEVGGMPFVLNLVETLNSLEVPYFIFDVSSRTHTEKGKRFFTVKRPVCQTFEIEISFSGSVVYRYTDSSQTQSWFGTNEPFGYLDETYDAPDNCVTEKIYL